VAGFVQESAHLGPMLRFLKYFRRKKLATILAFLFNIMYICIKSHRNIVFKKIADFLTEMVKIAKTTIAPKMSS
jgi:hypothetical protein